MGRDACAAKAALGGTGGPPVAFGGSPNAFARQRNLAVRFTVWLAARGFPASRRKPRDRLPTIISKCACHPERSGGGKAGAAESKDRVECSTSFRDPSTPFRPHLLARPPTLLDRSAASARDGTPLRMTLRFYLLPIALIPDRREPLLVQLIEKAAFAKAQERLVDAFAVRAAGLEAEGVVVPLEAIADELQRSARICAEIIAKDRSVVEHGLDLAFAEAGAGVLDRIVAFQSEIAALQETRRGAAGDRARHCALEIAETFDVARQFVGGQFRRQRRGD